MESAPAHRRVEQDMHQGVEMGFALRCQIEFFQPIWLTFRSELEQRFPGLIRAIVNAHAIQSRDEAQGKKRAAQRTTGRALTNK